MAEAGTRASLGARVRHIRLQRGLTQLQLAQMVGTSKSVIARLERGSTTPTFHTLDKIADALAVQLRIDLLQPDDNPLIMGDTEKRPVIKVLVADAQPLFAESLATALAQSSDIDAYFVRPSTPVLTGLEAAQAAARTKVDVVVVDYWLSEMDGPSTVRSILEWTKDAKVLVTSWFHGSREVQAALNAGATGFVPKSLYVAEFAEAVRTAHRGAPLVFSKELATLLDRVGERDAESSRLWHRFAGLTPRELDVLRLLATGRPMKQIATEMSITPGTLRIHMQNILSKTGAGSRLELVAFARQAGVI